MAWINVCLGKYLRTRALQARADVREACRAGDLVEKLANKRPKKEIA